VRLHLLELYPHFRQYPYMAEFTEALTEKHVEMIGKQPVFFVATAASDGRVNVSPKGYDAFRVLSPTRVAYLDLAGSGNETHAHLSVAQKDQGRITIMFCNFERPALILRIYGRGRAVLPQDEEWAAFADDFEIFAGTRQIFVIDVESVQTSCGWGVPFMTLDRERGTLKKAHASLDADAWLQKTHARTTSIDGIPTRATDRYFGPAQ
jgi:Pyridoxamine 5'-phosphate oxidase